MSQRIKIIHNLITKEHKDFASLGISCTHEYYSNSVCPDISLELAECSKDLLSQYKISYKYINNKLHIGYLGIESGKKINKDLPDTFPPIILKLRITNHRFWLVTDKKNLPIEHQPILFNKVRKEHILQAGNACFTDIRKLRRKLGQEKNAGTLELENIIGISTNTLKQFLPLKLEELLSRFNDVLIKWKEEYYFFGNSSDLLGVVLLDLKNSNPLSNHLKIPLKARSLKLRYKVFPDKRDGKEKELDQILRASKLVLQKNGKVDATSSPKQKRTPLSFNAKPVTNGEGYIIESEKDWQLQQNNAKSNSNFFKLRMTNERAKKDLDVFLPFPKRILSHEIKQINKTNYLEKEIKLLRYRKHQSK